MKVLPTSSCSLGETRDRTGMLYCVQQSATQKDNYLYGRDFLVARFFFQNLWTFLWD